MNKAKRNGMERDQTGHAQLKFGKRATHRSMTCCIILWPIWVPVIAPIPNVTYSICLCVMLVMHYLLLFSDGHYPQHTRRRRFFSMKLYDDRMRSMFWYEQTPKRENVAKQNAKGYLKFVKMTKRKIVSIENRYRLACPCCVAKFERKWLCNAQNQIDRYTIVVVYCSTFLRFNRLTYTLSENEKTHKITNHVVVLRRGTRQKYIKLTFTMFFFIGCCPTGPPAFFKFDRLTENRLAGNG